MVEREDSKMKPTLCLYLLLIATTISGCMPAGSMPTPIQMEADLPSPTVLLPTSTPIPAPTATTTVTPPATLEPEQAKEAIRTLLSEPADCAAPCFWGIAPGQTTLGEAINVFTRLGLHLEHTNTRDNKEFYGVIYAFDNGLSVTPILTIQDYVVENLRIKITPETQKSNISREWSAYSPETLIERYGTPSKVDFFFGGAAPDTSYAMDMYFDSNNFIIEYYSYDVGPDLQICPLIDQMSSVRVWMGENPVNPPPDGVLLEMATSLTMEEFTQLLTGDPNGACFNLNIDAF